MIQPAPLTDFTSEQLGILIDAITEAEKQADSEWAFHRADTLQLLKVQLHNALKVVEQREKIYQS